MYLTEKEIDHLTHKDGKHLRYSTQRKILNAMGITHKVRPDGSLAVLRTHVEKLLGGPPAARVARDEEPEWSAMPCAK